MRPTRTGWVLLAAAIVAGIILLSSVLVFAPSLLFGPRSPISGLTASVSADKDGYLPGEPVLITFTVMNAGDAIADVRFGSRCLASYAIRAPDGSAIYDYVSHFACLPAVANFSLRPGDSRVFTFSWGQTSDSGFPVLTSRAYRVQGSLRSMIPSPGPSAETSIFVMGGATEPNLAFTAQMDQAVYDPGNLAKVSVTLTNIGLNAVTMHFANPCFAQFVVLDPTGEAVYNSSKWWGCIQVLADVTLAPGESRSHVFPWNLSSDMGEPLPGGHEYRVVPSFLWVYASSYQRFVSRTDVATFTLTGSTSSFGT